MDYYSLTWREYILTVRGFSIKRSYEFENTRAIWHIIWAVNRSEKTAYQGPRELWPLITDSKDDEVPEGELERMQALIDKHKEL